MEGGFTLVHGSRNVEPSEVEGQVEILVKEVEGIYLFPVLEIAIKILRTGF